MNWQDLSMSERSKLIKLYLKNGITSLSAMKEHYNSFAIGGHLYKDGGPDDDKYSFLRREPEVAVADNTRYVRPIIDVEIDRASGLPEGTTTMRRIISAQVDRQQPVIKQDNTTNETHKSINKEVKKTQNAKKVNDVANAVAAVTSIPATIVAPEVMTPIFALQGFNDATDVLSKEGNLNTEDYGRLGLDALFMLPIFNTAGNYLRFNTNLGKSYELSRVLNKSIRNTELSQRVVENPSNNRFRLGDVELGDPSIAYRQGSQSMVDDFLSTGTVRSDGLGATAIHPKVEGKISLSKNFSNPMFKQGNLWYGIPENGSSRIGLLTTREPLQVATKTSAPNRSYLDIVGTSDTQIFGLDQGRRIPLNKSQLNLKNTIPYIFDQKYGYRRMQEPTPTLEQAMQEAEDAYVRNNPLAFIHEIEDMQLLNTIREFNGRRGSPSLGISRFDANGNAYTGYGNVRFYFPKEYIKGLKYYSWSDDALLPTTSDAIREAERRGIKLKYTEDGEALISPELESQLKIELLKDHPNLNKRDKNLETSIKNIRAINSPSHYGEVYPLEPVDLSKALYVQTYETYPTLTNWLKLNGIQYGTEVPVILDKRVTFKNGGKLN